MFEVIKSVQLVRLEGLPLHRGCSRSPDERTVALANNGDIEWKGGIHMRSLDVHPVECRELLTGKSIATQYEGTHAACDVIVPLFEVRILFWTERKGSL